MIETIISSLVWVQVLVIVTLMLAASIFDRLRGDKRGFNRFLEKLCYGGCLATVVYIRDPTMPIWVGGLLSLAWAGGSSLGWGEIIGSYLRSWPMREEKLKRWQVGEAATNVHVAMLLRGVLWTLPVVLVSHMTGYGMSMALAPILAFPLALVISKRLFVPEEWIDLPEDSDIKRGWQRGEYIRGALSGLFSAI